jgi:hypothetical protein
MTSDTRMANVTLNNSLVVSKMLNQSLVIVITKNVIWKASYEKPKRSMLLNLDSTKA